MTRFTGDITWYYTYYTQTQFFPLAPYRARMGDAQPVLDAMCWMYDTEPLSILRARYVFRCALLSYNPNAVT